MSDRFVVGVDPAPPIPKPPQEGSKTLLLYLSRLTQSLRFAFTRYGMAINANRLTSDYNKMRVHFRARGPG